MDLFSKLNATHRFRDPIYGFIEITDAELKIIDTPLFQRLRRVHQLALTKYVYPTAEHSRFTHSLGVMQSAYNIFKNIYRNSDSALFASAQNDEGFKKEIIDKIKILRFASLLHDIGHLPFSHAAEHAIFSGKANHEKLGKHIIINYTPIKDAIESEGIKPQIVASLLGDQVIRKYSILQNIVSGQLDADRADYLLRDSYCCGVKYGVYDYERYLQAFSLRCNDEGIDQLCIEEKNIYLLESFLMARYHYNLQVPYHRTRVGYDIVLERYIRDLKERQKFQDFIDYSDNNEILSVDYDFFEFFDDYTLFETIKDDSRKNKNIWASMLMRQGHLIPVYDHILKNEKDAYSFKSIVFRLKNNLNLKEDEDFFRYNKELEVSKLIKANGDPEKNKKNALGLISKGKEKIENILDYSNVLGQLVKPIEFHRLYVTENTAASAMKEVSKFYDEHEQISSV